jgi:hypothetical protein
VKAAGAGVDVLDDRDRTKIVAPGFAAIEQANYQGGAEDEREKAEKLDPVRVIEQDARADAERQETELEIVMVAPQPCLGQ